MVAGILFVAWNTASLANPPSAADCAAEADRASRGVGTGLGGVGRGAAGGAVFGAKKNDVYQNVYDACMRRR
jgi:hypothetical protein